jgi:Glycosyltransferase family 87
MVRSATLGDLEQAVVRVFGVLVCAAIVLPTLPRLGPIAGALAVLLGAATATPFWRWVPTSVSGGLRRRPVLAVLWVLAALVALVEIGGLAAFSADPDRRWGSAVPDPAATNHACLSAYFLAADLSRRDVVNLYDERYYPAFAGDAARLVAPASIEGLAKWIDDPFEYPPPFLVFPRAALLVSNHFPALRAGWFVLQALGLVLVAAWLARWVGGRDGELAFLLIPVLLTSLPTLLGLQFGQFHVATLLLSVTALICFEEKRTRSGAALLAVATVSKLFPAFLLVFLLARRRSREVAWTLGACAVFALVGLGVLGWSPFQAFLTYQLPRISSGEAFAFYEKAPEFIISRNFGIPGLTTKLNLLGVPGMTRGLGSVLGWIYTLGLLAIAWVGGLRPASRLGDARVWLGLLSLAALRSPLAPSAYVTISVLWLLSLLAGEVRRRPARAVALVVAWAAIMGPPPLEGPVELVVGFLGQATGIVVCLWAVLGPRPGTESVPQSALAAGGA